MVKLSLLVGVALIFLTYVVNHNVYSDDNARENLLLVKNVCDNDVMSALAVSFGNVSITDYSNACRVARISFPFVQYSGWLYILGFFLISLGFSSKDDSDEDESEEELHRKTRKRKRRDF